MHTHKPLIRMRYLLAIMLTVTLLSSILTVPSKAAVPADIVNAIEDGIQMGVGTPELGQTVTR